MEMKQVCGWILALSAVVFVLAQPFASAQNRVVVVPLGGGAVGNATPADVLVGKTFSNSSGSGLTGILVLPPAAQAVTNSVGMAFHRLPAGTFTMGSPASEPGRDDDETQHPVTLTRSFYMQTTEVTNGQWNAVIVRKGRGQNPSTSRTQDPYPVEHVNWYEAASFANWLSFDEGRIPCYNGNNTCSGTLGVDFVCTTVTLVPDCTGYRLPTEAQWECAARAGTTTAYANPVNFDDRVTETDYGFNANLHAMGWYEFNDQGGDLSEDVPGYASGTKPVARKQANAWGIYDMHGNVWEWCQDWWVGSDYDPDPVTDPAGDVTGTERVARGGYFGAFARECRAANRANTTPGSRSGTIGFRLVR
jgi:formylglycine-generating enzyme required for sulfatase activity